MTRSINKYYNLSYAIAVILVLLFQVPGYAQLGTEKNRASEKDAEKLYSRANLLYQQALLVQALSIAEQALEQSMIQDDRDTEVNSLELIGDITRDKEGASASIAYFLRAAGIYDARVDTINMLRIYRKVAEAYRSEKVYSRETEYYRLILSMLPPTDLISRQEFRFKIARASMQAGNPGEALAHYDTLSVNFQLDSSSLMTLHLGRMRAWESLEKYKEASEECDQLIELTGEDNASEAQLKLYNNRGYYQTLLGNNDKALDAYLAALEVANQTGADEAVKGNLSSNIAVSYANSSNTRQAVQWYNNAIGYYTDAGLTEEVAGNENMLAMLYYETGDLYNAGLYCREALSSSREAGNASREARACLTYSRVLRDGNDPVNALTYYERYLSIRDSIAFNREMRIQALEGRREMLKRQERNLRLQMKEDEVKDLALEQLRLQNEQIVQEKALIMQERNLDLLKQDSLRQSLIIKDQQYLVQRQERENRLLEQEKQLTDLKLKDEIAKQEALEREKTLLQQQQQLDQLELARQEADKKALLFAVAGVGLVTLLIFASLITTRRKNLLLAKQKEEIQLKNTDLEQKNEEISAQRDEIEAQRNLVYDQKQALESINKEIIHSIQYAERLQAAALPSMAILDEKMRDYFLFFKPRDVVSGDFYWFAEVEGKMVLTVSDCTGHGVPGAFMSIMGISLMKEIVQKEYIIHPGVILRRLRKEIIAAMGQKGVSGEQRDGMDMALISYDPENAIVDYAGAFNSLYMVRSKSRPAPQINDELLDPDMVNGENCLYEIKADRMPVAYFDKMDNFNNYSLAVYEGDAFYMSTDGFADQFGGEKGKKFKYKPFKRLLLQSAHLSMKQQHQILSETIDAWMGDIEQVDDICIMGVRI